MLILNGRAISPGKAEGKALVYGEAFSFLGGVDGATGRFNVMDADITDRVFVFPNGKGSTVGSYVIYDLMVHGHAPAGLVNRSAETIVTTGAVISSVPMVDSVDIGLIRDGDDVVIDGDKGTVELVGVKESSTATAMVVCNGKVLELLRRPDAHSYPGKWSLVSGRIENGEDPLQTAVREVAEETGIKVCEPLAHMDMFYVRGKHTVYDIHPFLFVVDSEDVVLDTENADYRWVPLSEFEAEGTVDGVDRIVSCLGKRL